MFATYQCHNQREYHQFQQRKQGWRFFHDRTFLKAYIKASCMPPSMALTCSFPKVDTIINTEESVFKKKTKDEYMFG